MIENSRKLFQSYIPNLLITISEKEFLEFLNKAYSFTILNDGKFSNSNFISTFFMLIEEVKNGESQEVRNEFGYFNFLLGEFLKFGKNKEFKNLVLSVINNFKNVLGEIAACLVLSQNSVLLKYEKILENKKSIDFEFKDVNGNVFLIDVLNFNYDLTRYQKGEPFEKFICGRLKSKFDEKSENLNFEEKNRLIIFPIIYGLTIEIVRDNEAFLTTLLEKRYLVDGFNCFNPMVFAKVQGTYFNLFTMKDVAIGELRP